MTPSTERRAVAFIRTVANRCTSCMRRSPEVCGNCISQWANEIMRDYESELGSSRVDYSLAARKMKIIDTLKRAARPLFAHEIDLSGICSRELKRWTLRRMERLGQIVRIPCEEPGDLRIRFRYALPRSKRNTTTPPEGTEK